VALGEDQSQWHNTVVDPSPLDAWAVASPPCPDIDLPVWGGDLLARLLAMAPVYQSQQDDRYISDDQFILPPRKRRRVVSSLIELLALVKMVMLICRRTIPVICGTSSIPTQQNVLFTELTPITDIAAVKPKPDFFDGARLNDLNQGVKDGHARGASHSQAVACASGLPLLWKAACSLSFKDGESP
jgi:hypothetical protein